MLCSGVRSRIEVCIDAGEFGKVSYFTYTLLRLISDAGVVKGAA